MKEALRSLLLPGLLLSSFLLLAALPPKDAPVEHGTAMIRVPLDPSMLGGSATYASIIPNTLPHTWNIGVARHNGTLSSVTVGLDLNVSTDIQYENTGNQTGPFSVMPWGTLNFTEDPTVTPNGGSTIYSTHVGFSEDTPAVSKTYDGTTDYDGASGTTTSVATMTFDGSDDAVDRTLFEGTGSITLTLDFPTSHSSITSHGSSTYSALFTPTTETGSFLVVIYQW